VLQRIKDSDSPILLWELDQSYIVNDPEEHWVKGQIEIKSEQIPGFEYRVKPSLVQQ
jgi:hypothetical protein